MSNQNEYKKERCLLRRSISTYTTLAYIFKGDQVLLLYRNKKKDDLNAGKYVGIGGHIEKGESYIAAMKREILEETGLTVMSYEYKGQIDFLNLTLPSERMYLFKVTGFSGRLKDCDEGELVYVKKDKVTELPIWEGDKTFLPLLELNGAPKKIELLYDGDKLLKSWQK